MPESVQMEKVVEDVGTWRAKCFALTESTAKKKTNRGKKQEKPLSKYSVEEVKQLITDGKALPVDTRVFMTLLNAVVDTTVVWSREAQAGIAAALGAATFAATLLAPLHKQAIEAEFAASKVKKMGFGGRVICVVNYWLVCVYVVSNEDFSSEPSYGARAQNRGAVG